jgi:hypothetical protein
MVLWSGPYLQKEMALYIASKANLEFSQFNIDDDVDPLFKVNIILYTCWITFVMINI